MVFLSHNALSCAEQNLSGAREQIVAVIDVTCQMYNCRRYCTNMSPQRFVISGDIITC